MFIFPWHTESIKHLIAVSLKITTNYKVTAVFSGRFSWIAYTFAIFHEQKVTTEIGAYKNWLSGPWPPSESLDCLIAQCLFNPFLTRESQVLVKHICFQACWVNLCSQGFGALHKEFRPCFPLFYIHMVNYEGFIFAEWLFFLPLTFC